MHFMQAVPLSSQRVPWREGVKQLLGIKLPTMLPAAAALAPHGSVESLQGDSPKADPSEEHLASEQDGPEVPHGSKCGMGCFGKRNRKPEEPPPAVLHAPRLTRRSVGMIEEVRSLWLAVAHAPAAAKPALRRRRAAPAPYCHSLPLPHPPCRLQAVEAIEQQKLAPPVESKPARPLQVRRLACSCTRTRAAASRPATGAVAGSCLHVRLPSIPCPAVDAAHLVGGRDHGCHRCGPLGGAGRGVRARRQRSRQRAGAAGAAASTARHLATATAPPDAVPACCPRLPEHQSTVAIIVVGSGRIHVPEPLAHVHATNGALPYILPLDTASM